MLNARSDKVNKSLDDADKVEKRLVAVEKEIDIKLADANKQTNLLIAQAKQQGKDIETNMSNQAQIKADQIIKKAKIEIGNQQQKMLSEAQTKIASLVAESIRMIADDKTINLDTKMIDSTISKIKQSNANGQ